MADPKVKTVGTRYIVKVDNAPLADKPTLREARLLIKSMPINDAVTQVQIIKETTTETILDTYEPKVTRVLVASQLDDDLNLNEEV